MIIGIGHDITAIDRIEKALARYGARFEHRCFSAEEIALAQSRPLAQRAATYAKRFAAKEACVKALGTGVADGVYLRDISVTTQKSGKPELVLTGGAARTLRSLMPDGFDAKLHLSLSDEPPYASAFVAIEACHPSKNQAS